MTEYHGSNDPRGSGARGDDPPTVPIPVVPAVPIQAVPATPVPPWPLPAGTAGPALEGVVLSELESEYVARHFEHQPGRPGMRRQIPARQFRCGARRR
jgi:hypothetical protein